MPLRRIRNRFAAPSSPPPAPATYDGQTVVVTGGTAGIGLAAAIRFAKLGADVVVTYRSAARGEAARRRIAESVLAAGVQKTVTVTLMRLDMGSYASCVAFVDELRRSYGGKGVDVVVLNAGRMSPNYETSAEGWEQTIQVNALSTILLGLLLLPWMKEERAHRESPAHLVFTSSRDHLYPNAREWAVWAKNEGILNHLNDDKNWPSFWATQKPNYANSKLLLMYGIREITDRALGPDGKPEVIVTSYCPGTVRTEIARDIARYNWLARLIVPIYMAVLGKSLDNGGRHCVAAAMMPEHEHGRFATAWLSEEQYNRKARLNVTSDCGKNIQAMAWKEIIRELKAKVPTLQSQTVHSESSIEK
ncbi:hypothetical protein GGR53DRAFT_527500 [Hypoxylon sp. FL1150]|nr:hypothetical protein GGR53DRAFT_527500 [Hypoxylon sp. FL1150]